MSDALMFLIILGTAVCGGAFILWRYDRWLDREIEAKLKPKKPEK